jgi:tetratricopeptide (TPR) repeat protein
MMIANAKFAAPRGHGSAASRLNAPVTPLYTFVLAGILVFGVMVFGARGLRAAQQDSAAPPPPRNETVEKTGKSPAPAPATADNPAKSDAYDPMHAAKDVEVGTYYMHKGDISAAIDRFKHAITLRENFAKPRLLLGECYEKKDDPENAIHYYQEYLKVLPHAPAADKIRERIARLTREQQESSE